MQAGSLHSPKQQGQKNEHCMPHLHDPCTSPTIQLPGDCLTATHRYNTEAATSSLSQRQRPPSPHTAATSTSEGGRGLDVQAGRREAERSLLDVHAVDRLDVAAQTVEDRAASRAEDTDGAIRSPGEDELREGSVSSRGLRGLDVRSRI